ncbi:putative RNA recognition motif domain, nucleotide-binding alpha-beta plait domain superfamily [Helianthus anomalus]
MCRFSNVVMCTYNGFKVKVFSRFLTPHVTYTINIIFKINLQNYEVTKGIGTCVSCSYKLDDGSHYLYSSNANMREDGWLAVDKTKFTNVFVKNHSESTSDEDLRKEFNEYGTITSAVVRRDADGNSKCFGFVKFESTQDAAKAVERRNGQKFDEKEWFVRKAPKKE